GEAVTMPADCSWSSNRKGWDALAGVVTEGDGALLQLAYKRKNEMNLKRCKKTIFAQERKASIPARPALRYTWPFMGRQLRYFPTTPGAPRTE
ncbi:MAG TPA: hypothetical protein VKE70_06775, partial [Candidatus Solibacter sp.]|nr:hypothetical protein [Candidatus Solibacter sp.]